MEPAARSQQTLSWPAAPEQTTTPALPTRVDASAARPPTDYKGLSGPQQLIPGTTSALAALDEADMLPGDHVIWLDDVDRYLSGGGLTAGLIMRLAERNVVVATLRAREWDRFQPTDQLRPPEGDALSVFEKVTLDRDRDRPSEEDLAQAVPDVESRERITRVGIGEYVGAAERIADQLALGAQSHPLGYALVCGAVDWLSVVT